MNHGIRTSPIHDGCRTSLSSVKTGSCRHQDPDVLPVLTGKKKNQEKFYSDFFHQQDCLNPILQNCLPYTCEIRRRLQQWRFDFESMKVKSGITGNYSRIRVYEGDYSTARERREKGAALGVSLFLFLPIYYF